MRSLLSWVTFGTVAAVAAAGVWASPAHEVRKTADDPVTTRPQTVELRPVTPVGVAPVPLAGARKLSLTRVTLRETKVYGGYGTRATVLLSKGAPAAGVTLRVAVAKGLKAARTVRVTKGTRTATFWIGTARVRKPVSRLVRVSYGTVHKQVRLKVHPWPRVVDFVLSAGTIVGGGTMSGAVKLSGPAKPGGTVVKLTSSSKTVKVPGSLKIPAGMKLVKFPIRTSGVTRSVTVTLKVNKVWTLRLRVIVSDPYAARIAKLELNPADTVGGGSIKATVTLDRVAPARGVKVTFAATSVAAKVPGLPVTVPAGQQAVTVTVPTTAVPAKVVAGLSASTNGTSGRAALTIRPTPAVNGFTTAQPEVQSGDQVTATVSIDAPAPAEGTAITLTSPDPAIRFPGGVRVPANARTVSFAVTAGLVENGPVTAAMTAATGGGGRSAALLIRPRLLLTSNAGASVTTGDAVDVTAALGAYAQSDITLDLNLAGVAGGPAVTVAQGEYKVTFTVTVTGAAGSNATVGVTGNGKALVIGWPVTG
ncbi:MAG: hypothetical protein ABIS86_11415 [Streptosporangiaceae bacterium]